MIRIAALNDSISHGDDREEAFEGGKTRTKEAQEAEAMALYHQALDLQKRDQREEATKVYKQLLTTPLLQEALVGEGDVEGAVGRRPDLLLKYSAFKNLARLAEQDSESTKALNYYLEAVQLDSSDVSLWQRLASVACSLSLLPLARYGWLQGLERNPGHWPCLNGLMTVLYALGDHTTCLYYISQALMKDCGCAKALALREQIFREYPSLRVESISMFADCDPAGLQKGTWRSDACQIVDEALQIRQKRKERAPTPPPSPPAIPPQHLQEYTWKSFGEFLMASYRALSATESQCCFLARPLDLSPYALPPPAPTSTPVSVIQAAPPACLPPVSTGLVSPLPSCLPLTVVAVPPLSQVPSPSEACCGSTESLSQDVNLERARRGAKRKRIVAEEAGEAAKRRSARVRNTRGKKEGRVDVHELLLKFLPSRLKCAGNDEDDEEGASSFSQMDTHNSAVPEMSCQNSAAETSNLTGFCNQEREQVVNFLGCRQTNLGVLSLMQAYLKALAVQATTLWPKGLTDVFLAVYTAWRSNLPNLPSPLLPDASHKHLKEVYTACLVAMEIQLDRWLTMKGRIPTVSPRKATGPAAVFLGPGLPAQTFLADVGLLSFACGQSEPFGDYWMLFAVRVQWLSARLNMLLGDTDRALTSFDACAELLQTKEESDISKGEKEVGAIKEATHDIQEESGTLIRLPNLVVDSLISTEEICKKLQSLERCQSLEEVQRLFEAEDYSSVVSLLQPTLTSGAGSGGGTIAGVSQQTQSPKSASFSAAIPERPAQLLLLQNSLLRLKDFAHCLECSETALQEALQQACAPSTSSETRTAWQDAAGRLLAGIDHCLAEDSDILLNPSLTPTLVGLTASLVQLLEGFLGVEGMDPPPSPELPWLVLYRIIRHEEQRVQKIRRHQGISEESPLMSSSIMLLNSAHQMLGRRACCTDSNGALLKFYVRVLQEELAHGSRNEGVTPGTRTVENREDGFEMSHDGVVQEDAHPFREDLENALEQCFFCLYAYPSKKAKARYLEDHGVRQVELTWAEARPLFEFFRPRQLPEFDSYKASTVSADLANLLRRLVPLIPSPPPLTLDHVANYIEGVIDQPPVLPPVTPAVDGILSELYYLLADYHFKNKEQTKAIRYYLLDICVSPLRFDSWAGMALARASRIQDKLNSNELKNDGPIWRPALAVLACFHRALQLQPNSLPLWIEAGATSYALHSLASRQRRMPGASSAIVTQMTEYWERMLTRAEECFLAARGYEGSGSGEGEEWLAHYMLGKIAEKRRKQPEVYLEHYKQAAFHLHEVSAKYPKKVHYHNPPDLAMEALEVYYRLHASILKLLERSEEDEEEPEKDESEKMDEKMPVDEVEYLDYKLLFSYMWEATHGPFARGEENKSSDKERTSLTDEEPSRCLLPPAAPSRGSHPVPGPPSLARPGVGTLSPFPGVPCDHDYSRPPPLPAQADREGSIIPEMEGRVGEGDTRGVGVDHTNPTCATETKKEAMLEAGADGTIHPAVLATPAPHGPPPLPTDHAECRKLLLEYCVGALRLCLSRFPQHYKSLYRLAHLYLHGHKQQLTWAKDVLLGSEVPWQLLDHMPAQGLFFERNKTNFFNGIWRIPVDEVDRPGSFASHMSRSVMLLLDVLPSLGEVGTLLRLSSTLHRTPDQGKKFLRDLDRQQLAQKAFGLGVQVLETQLRALCQDREHANNKDVVAPKPPATVVSEGPCVAASSRMEGGAQGLLVEAFRAWQQGQRMAGTHDLVRLEKIMVASLGLLGEQETSVEHAIRFCQQLLAAPTQRQPISDAPKRETSATTPPFASRIVPQIAHASSAQASSGPLLLASDGATKPPRSPTAWNKGAQGSTGGTGDCHSQSPHWTLPRGPVEAALPHRPVDTPFPRRPVETPFSRRPVETAFPRRPLEMPFPRRVMEPHFSRKSVDSQFPRRPLEPSFPRRCVEPPFPKRQMEPPFSRSVETPFPRRQLQVPFSKRPGETQFPRRPVEVQFIRRPVAPSFLQRVAEVPFPRRPIESSFPRRPVETAFPRKLGETAFPLKLSETAFPRKPGETAFPGKLVETAFPRKTVETAFPRKPVETAFPRKPVETAFPRKPVETAFPRKPVETAFPRKPVETAFPRKPVETASPRKPVETAFPRKPVETAFPRKPVETAFPRKPVETAFPRKPVETAFPRKPVETAFPRKPVETAFPRKPVETAFPRKPVETAFPLKPVETAFPRKPVETAFPRKPVETAFPRKPVDTAFPRKPGETSFPCRPGQTSFPQRSVEMPSPRFSVPSQSITIQSKGPNLQLSHSPWPASSASISDAACSRSFTSPVSLPEARPSTHQSDSLPIVSPPIAHEPQPVSNETKNKLTAAMLSNRWPSTSSSPTFPSPSANLNRSPLPCQELPTGLAPETPQGGGSGQVKGSG
uniref:calcineurin-binding protein cabin-1-like isoform X2 n=1 Tax=Myxine glutinosa TaxID=7769 RepID=UPI00358F5181